ncbi:MAG: 3-dehydroquinate synthase [Thermoleophilia bacterium]|nr:3-dehydroquinate synthase [Thermoleophilia bacterium]
MAALVALTGFMGSGKTSVGKEVASLLDLPFVDLDEEFSRTAHTGIPEFFAAHGEAAFRRRECEILEGVLRSAAVEAGLILALGGGTLESPQAAQLLTASGGVVLLDVDAGTAWARVKGSGRPLAVDQEQFEALLARRRATYCAVADWILPVGERDISDLAAEIVHLVTFSGDHWRALWGRRLRATERASVIIGGDGALDTLLPRVTRVRAKGSRLFAFTDANVMAAWGDPILGRLGDTSLDAVLVVEPGEASKSAATLERCWDWLAEQGARRDDVIVALGGGVVGDLAGFVAATYQRGVSLWQIPTSLLAQVDSSVGGKTAINLPAGKNLVGAFYQPDLVVADPGVLTTLPDEEYAAGLGEVVKHALLVSPTLLTWLEEAAEAVRRRDPAVVSELVKRCVFYKADVVEEDERETGRRAVLNLGHTTAHALEVTQGYGALRHGSAVALGLLVALAVSERLLALDPRVRERTRLLLETLGLPTTTRLPDVQDLLGAARHDKKVRAGSSGFVGLAEIGVPVWGLDLPEDEFMQALEVIGE